MNKTVLVFLAIIAVIAFSGCPDPYDAESQFRSDGTPYSGSGPYDDPNMTYYDTGNPNASASTDSGDCGYFEGPCCEWIGTDAFGMLTAMNYCNDDLECRGGVCVEGPYYEAYDPRTHGYE
ncbi:MAG: hypothetical protein JW772_04525 [Candidatus Diapherotrites archaeon]|nr:hypothetical protein [Candidatus Diapherotrites archaeon]